LSKVQDRSSKERQAVLRMDSVRDCTVSELVDWCVQRNIDPAEVKVTAAHVKWSSLETVEERDNRLAWWEETDARHTKWEFEMWERLKKKYGETEGAHASEGSR